MRKLLITYLLFFASSLLALEVDEKLTVRIIEVSKTRKTVLINRGQEDGVNVGDHAKFYLTSGVVARGVVVKSSPSRSVWSIYRLIDPSQIVADAAMNILATPPIKLTEDPTKMVSESTLADGGVPKIPVDADDKTIAGNLTDMEKNELSFLRSKTGMIEEDLLREAHKNRTFEIWAGLNVTPVNGQITYNDSTESETDFTNVNYSFGIEKYFQDKDSFLHDFSFTAFYHRNHERGIEENIDFQSDDFGLGINWHFLHSPLVSRRLIGHFQLTAGMSDLDGDMDGDDVDGDGSFFSFGLGGKYYFTGGVGLRVLVDYYRSAQVFEMPNSDQDADRVASGPRLTFAISYRF